MFLFKRKKKTVTVTELDDGTSKLSDNPKLPLDSVSQRAERKSVTLFGQVRRYLRQGFKVVRN